MKKEFLMSDAKFIYSKNELGYKEVLEDFKTAEEIIIVTYNISEKQTQLIDALRGAAEETEISIFTNIPSRWDTYYGGFESQYRLNARKKINVYLAKLKPDGIGERVNVFFNFDNHGKIVMTNNVVYVGSSNYSEESGKNIEFGIISTDKDFITYLKDDIVNELKETAVKYYDYDYLPLILEVELNLSNLYRLREELFGQVYVSHERIESKYYFNDTNEMLSQVTIDSIRELLKILKDNLSAIYDAADSIVDDEYILDIMNEKYEVSIDLYTEFEEIAYDEFITELANFDSGTRANDILSEEYSAQAYDEYLEGYIQKSMDTVNEEFKELCWECKDSLDILIRVIDDQLANVRDAIEEFKSLEYRKICGEIDNTKQY
ncbi:6-phosphogluconolactonase [Clostridium algidicarnis]|uniref:6-phosphogluconolactonase n=1 Tax=Clostridium algidicarnis TaxID=37659 RepID=UPI001C0DA721|nr:6-phosphogluconolactonase [Clostridium algidicarnis]MBU3196518.1 6-phosphogluconolactonase [Clostridium algidicarnis]MCB2287804.1 6-phosphogluconolactonase [Clostridium algidicarnis]